MSKENEPLNLKKHVKTANDKREKDPNHAVVAIVDSLIQSGLIDEEGNIVNLPEEKTGKKRK